MIEVNMIAPKGSWTQFEKWRGLYTIFYRQKGQMFQTCCHIMLWGCPDTKSFYTAKKVKQVVYYQQN